jgi:hypothetical protein
MRLTRVLNGMKTMNVLSRKPAPPKLAGAASSGAASDGARLSVDDPKSRLAGSIAPRISKETPEFEAFDLSGGGDPRL